MNEERIQLLLIRGAIAELPEADRKGIEQAATNLREVVATHNDHGKMALALVGAELAAED
jgi:phosphatidylserine decarboxylase